MKNKKLLIAILCIFVFDLPGAANRIRQNFDFDWQFRLGENGDFREVQLPHDWSVELDFDEKAGGASGYLPGGIGWYRKSFMIPASYKNQKVSLVLMVFIIKLLFFEWKGDCLSSLWIYFV